MNFTNSPILTKSNRAIGQPTIYHPTEQGQRPIRKFSPVEVFNYQLDNINTQAQEILASTDNLSEDQVNTIAHLEDQYEQISKDKQQFLAQEQSLEEPWFSLTDAIAGPLAWSKTVGSIVGKLTAGTIKGIRPERALGAKGLAKAITAALPAEAVTGQTLDIIEEELENTELPWYAKRGVMLPLSIGIGGITQYKFEKGIEATGEALNKAINRTGMPPLAPSQVKKTVKKAKRQIEDEVQLTTLADNISKKKKKPSKIAKVEKIKDTVNRPANVTKPKSKKTKIEKKPPIFLEENVATRDSEAYATLDDVKAVNKEEGIFDEIYQEAEDVDEFFTTGLSARKMAEALFKKGYSGIKSDSGIRKFNPLAAPEAEQKATEDLVTTIHKNMLARAKTSAGSENSITGLSAGVYAGIEWDEEKERIVGFNPAKAALVAAGVAAGLPMAKAIYTPARTIIDKAKGRRKEIATANLNEAKKMEAASKDSMEIALNTDFIRDPDSKQWVKWSPDNAKLTENIKPYTVYQLKNALLDADMDKYYPELLENTSVTFRPGNGGGSYNPITKAITIYSDPTENSEKALSTLLHERQHRINDFEGLSWGGHPNTFKAMLKWYSDKTISIRKGVEIEDLAELTLYQRIEDTLDANVLDTMAVKSFRKAIKDLAYHKGKDPFSDKAWNLESAIDMKIHQFGDQLYLDTSGERMASTKTYDEFISVAQDTGNNALINGRLVEDTRVALLQRMDKDARETTGQAMLHIEEKSREAGIRPGFLQRWEDSSNRIIDTIKHNIDGQIYNTQARRLLGIDLPSDYRELIKVYDRATNRILDHTLKLAKELDDLAPTQKEQKRMMQILRGGVTANTEVMRKAIQVKEATEKMREVAIDSGLRSYDAYDRLTKRELRQLRNITKFSDIPDQVIAAQKAIQQHYRAGTSYNYMPVFFRTKEGIVGSERKEIVRHLKKLQAWTQANTGRVSDDIIQENRAEIEEYRKLLKLGSEGNKAYNPERKHLTRTYRDVVLPEESSVALHKSDNVIKSASFTAARGIAEQAIDIQRKSFLEAVADNPYWAMAKGTDEELIPSHFKQLKGERYGALNGMYVDKQIAQDIDDVGTQTHEFLRAYDKVLGLWKLGKAVYNPATHVANTVSNTFLAQLGGVSPGDIKTYSQAAQAVRSRRSNRWFREAEEWGLMNNTFSAAELSQFRKSLASFREHPQKAGAKEEVKKTLKAWFNKPSQLYEANEQFFKMAVFIKARKNGKSVDEAAKHAEEYLFNYRDIPPIVRHYKRFASPFFTFVYKWSGLLAKEAIRHPHKLAIWGGAYASWMVAAEYMTGAKEGKIKRDRDSMPGFGALHMPLPWRDEDGNMQYWDMSRFTPLGVFNDKWGQSDFYGGAYAPTANPFIGVLYELQANKDAFTGREIYNSDIENVNQMLGKMAEHAWHEFTPSLTPGNYGFDKIMEGITALERDVIDYTGQEVTFQDKIMEAILGVKVTSATEEAMMRTLKSELMRIDLGIGKSMSRARREYKRGEITKEEYEAIAEKYLKQKRVLKKLSIEKRKE